MLRRAGFRKVKRSAADKAVVPPAVDTRTRTVPAHDAGVRTRNLLPVEPGKMAARNFPKSTAFARERLLPLIVIT